VGDVNLGRLVGQEILRGDTLYPFVFVTDTFAQYDIVFANLESQLSEQGGETQHPVNNLIFTGPPAGAWSLQYAGVHVVSTANNHALDYGVRGLRETMRNLRDAGVGFVGTSGDSAQLYVPLIVTRNDIRLALFGVTDVMNIENPVWKRYVANADTGRLLPQIRAYRDSVDFIVVSYHGGEEYADVPTARTREFAAEAIRGGADLFLGHHPHVTYGVEEVEGKYIVHSLGNFVFRQPDRYWTQRSFALSATVAKDSTGTRVARIRCLPVLAGLQPVFADGDEATRIQERIDQLSSPTAFTYRESYTP
jgi:poly-gamma-glutamate synthesis protein (capsule biosynthesis protein)